MADTSINVKITADASGFIAGIQQAQQATQQLGGATTQFGQAVQQAGAHAANLGQGAREGGEHLNQLAESAERANEGMRRLGEGFRHAAELFGIGLGIKEAIEGLERLAEMGEHMENTAAAIGMPVEQFAKLSGAMQLVGGDADTARRSLILWQSKLVEAAAAPSKVRGELEALGYSMADIKRSSEDAYFSITRLAQAKVQFGDSAEKVTIFKDLLGARGMTEVIALLNRGPEGIAELTEKTTGLTGLTEPVIHDLAQTSEKINEFKQALEGVGVAIYENFKKPIDSTIESLKEWLKQTDQVKAKLDTLAGATAGAWAGFRVGAAAGPIGAIVGGVAGGIAGGEAGASGIAHGLEALKEQYDTFKSWWSEADAWIKDHTGSGEHSLAKGIGNLLPESWTKPSQFLAPAKPLSFEEFYGNPPAKPLSFEEFYGNPPAEPEPAKPTVPEPVDPEKERKNLDQLRKINEDEVKAKEAYYELLKAQANGNRQAINLIEQQKVADLQTSLDHKRQIYQAEIDALKKRNADEKTIEAIVPKDTMQSIDTEERHLQIQQTQADNAAKNDAARDAIKLLEIQRKGADEQESLALHVIERRVSLGEIAVDAAAGAEEQIMQAHANRVAQILQQEAQQAAGQKRLMEEVRDTAIRVEQEEANKLREAQEKSYEDRVKRAKEIDKELASSLADAIMGVAEHKESWGQALQKFFEAQEKKLLEKSLQKLFDSSGLGESLGGLGELLGFGGNSSPEDALKIATSANTDATRLNTGASGALTKVIELLTRQLSQPGTTATGTGATTGGTGGSSGIESAGTHGSASENVANFNYGNMRAKGGGWQSFASPEAGALAIGAQLDRYASGATTGKPVTTLEGMISTWAPPNENNTAELIKRASERTGIAPGETVDLSNPDVRRAMTQAIVQQENPKAVEQAMAAYDRAVAGGGTQLAAAPSSDIIDKTAALGFGNKYGTLGNVQGMIVHHTGGGKNVDDIIRTFQERDVASQFVIDRSGQTYRTLPEGAEGRHIKTGWGPVGEGKSNANMEGVEIIAANDRDVLPIQREAAARLIGERAARWGYDPRTSVFGHGEVNPGHKEADEGMSTVSRIRSGEQPVPTDIRAIAGSPLATPATTSGGGLPVVAAPPSASTGQPAAATTLGAYLDKAAPLYGRVTGGADLRADLTSAAGGGLGAIGPGLRLKGALDNPELKAIVDEASAGYKAKTGNDLLGDVQSGKPLADILATKIEANTAAVPPQQVAEGGPGNEPGASTSDDAVEASLLPRIGWLAVLQALKITPLNEGELQGPELAEYIRTHGLGPDVSMSTRPSIAAANTLETALPAVQSASAPIPPPPPPWQQQPVITGPGNEMPPAGGSQGWAGISGPPGTPSGPSPLSFEEFYGLPAPPGPFGGEGMLTREHEAGAKATQDHTKAVEDDTKATQDSAQAKQQAPTPAAGAGANTGGDTTGSSSGGGLLGLLGPLLAIGGIAASAGLFNRRGGTPASSSPGTVFTRGGITTQTQGSVHPALNQANPSSNLSFLPAAIAGISALAGLSKLFGGGGGKGSSASLDTATQQNTHATQQNTQALQAKTAGGGAVPGLGSTNIPTGGGSAFAGEQDFSGGLTGAGENVQSFTSTASSIDGLTTSVGNLTPAAQTASSSTANLGSTLLSALGKLGGLLGGGGGGGGGGFGGIFSLIGGLFGLEKGGVVPSAAGGMVVGAGGAVPDGKGGRLIVAHPQEMVLPARESRGLSNLLGSFQAGPPPEGGLGRILSMRMMVPSVPHFAQGAWEIDRDMLGMLHQGEQIIPSSYAAGLRAMGGGAPTTSSPSVTYGDTHVHLSAIDSRSGAQFLMAHSDTIGKALYRAHRNGSRYTPNG